MNTTNYKHSNTIKKQLITLAAILLSFVVWSQERPQDSTSTGHSLGNLQMPNPASIVSKYTYDPLTDRYIYTESVGTFNISYPVILTPKEFQDLVAKENLKSYYKQKVDAFDGKKEGSEEEQKNLLPEFYVNSGFFETIFGSNTIEVVPQGSVEMDLGILFSKQDNPSFSPRNRSNFTFDFDQRISLSLLGKVGTRLQVTANYDTESTFDFQNLVKLEYTPTEDDIIQKIEVGNVSMPLNSSLITGAQSLFGVKTELQFGKTTITAVFSEQKSDTKTVVAQGGGTLDEFDFFARDYDENRHFFLAHYFRNNYDAALNNYPFINSQVQITRIEAWVTNRNNRTENVRNIVALQDLGETDVVGSAVNILGAPGAYPDNDNNAFNPTKIGEGGSQLSDLIRDIATVQSGILIGGVSEGADYAKLENARKLQEGQEYILNTQLGYISLNQRLNNDEVLAVAFQYTVAGQVYQVGEFANDGVDATGVTTDNNGDVTGVTNNNLVLKLLKSPITSVSQPIWDLMMKNIYDTGAYQLSQEDFKLNIFYNEGSPVNFITPVAGTTFPVFDANTPATTDDSEITETPLIRLFHIDKLNFNNDPQVGGDGFFDFVPNITVIPQNGKIVFTKVEPFGRYLFDILDDDGNPTNNDADYELDTYTNPNHEKFVYDILYKETKTAALEEVEKNKFQIKGRYKSVGGDGIPIGAFNVPRGSVKVTAGGRVLVEGIDYTVNYQLGRVQILDEALKASNTPIEVSTENNSIFGQTSKRFFGINVEHKFNENFVIGATYISLKERPITQKANYNSEPINNKIYGLNVNYSSEVPFLTRLVNKLPNIDTDVPSNFSVRGEVAVLRPGAPKGTDFQGEVTSYVDDFEGSQSAIELKSAQSWYLSSRPVGLTSPGSSEDPIIENGYGRAMLNWYHIDPIFYSSRRPDGISDDDMSSLYTSRVFINELFPQQDIAQGQTTVLNTLDLAYYPEERGPYNFHPDSADGIIDTPENSWAGISRQIASTDFEQANVEYIEFWLQDPFQENATNTGGKLVFNLGNISEDIIKDGRKLYENGLPQDGNIAFGITATSWGTVVPQNQSLIYAFDTTGDERTNQDVGYDGYDDDDEVMHFPSGFNPDDPANDNYSYFLNADGDVFERYKRYNGVDGNSPDTFSDTNRGRTTQPDVEDINRDNTMNTIDGYFEYEIDITPADLNVDNNPLIVDAKFASRNMPNGTPRNVNWYQFRIPISEPTTDRGGDIRSMRFARMYVKDFTQPTVFRFGSLDLVRSEWRRYSQTLDEDLGDPSNDNTNFSIGVINTIENDGDYESPPGVDPEELYNNNTVIRQNEQSLVVNVCDLESHDARAVYKNINVDMRQYENLKMFMHAETGDDRSPIVDTELVGFIRMGNDLSQNYYQIEVPLKVSTITPPYSDSNRGELWPDENELNIDLSLLQEIKAKAIADNFSATQATFYNILDGAVSEDPVAEYSAHTLGQQRVAIFGNPNFGDIRTLMIGVKNATDENRCGKVWFNELRLAGLNNEGGWATVVSADANLADFANISATGRYSTSGFGSIEQGPQERSIEDVKQYDVVTNINVGQLLPKKWGVQIPFNYGQGEESITPKYDQLYEDIELQTRIDAAETNQEKETIKKQSETFTKRKSINFIGVRKNRTSDKEPRFYDVENLTLSYSYNKIEHRDFEIERSLDQQVRTGVNYAYNFNPLTIEPFKKNDSLFTSDYLKLLKDFNLSFLPSSFTVNTNYTRQFNRQKFRDLDLGGTNIGLEELYRRNYNFDFQYTINYNLTKSLNFDFTASNNNIVRNYFVNDQLNGRQDPELNVWDDFFDVGDPNRQFQKLGVNYQIPINKIPTFSFINATYTYSGEFQWQKGSDLFSSIQYTDPNAGTPGHVNLNGNYNLGNSISNASQHNINASLDMNKLYKYIGIKQKRVKGGNGKVSRKEKLKSATPPSADSKVKKPKTKKNSKLANFGIGLITSVKRVQLNYNETNGTYLPGYKQTPGFIGTLKPTFGYTFGSQRDVRSLAARNGWLTEYPEFNQQYLSTQAKQFDYAVNVEPFRDLKIDIIGNRIYAENFTENYNVSNDLEYHSLTPNTFGNYAISAALIKTAFSKSDENQSKPFEDFRKNRLIIANRLAEKFYGTTNYTTDANGFPEGFGKSNQSVLLPAFLAAYKGQNASKTNTSVFRNFPVPNWDLKYTGFMKLNWIKKHFKRFSLSHGYRSTYTINQFRTNLDLNTNAAPVAGVEYANQPEDATDQNGDFKNEKLYSNINLTEQFSPLFRLDFESKSDIKILLEMKKDRMLSLSFDNNLVTEIQGKEYKVGLGYRVKEVRMKSKLAGPTKTIISDINLKADVSLRDNKTIIRYLDLENNQITSGQTLWSAKFTADYAFSKNLTGIFYFDYTFSEYAISTAFPQTTIRSGLTLRYNFGN